MTFPARIRIGSYRKQFLLALLSLLLAALAAIVVINAHFHRRVADEHVRQLAQQGLKRAEARLQGIASVAADQNAVLQNLIRQHLDHLDLVSLLSELAPAFIARPVLTYVGVGLEATGEYAMLERIEGKKMRLRHFTLRADGGREIHDYWPDAANRMTGPEIVPWNGYDPRPRPFYLAAKKAGHAVWTDSFVFLGDGAHPSELGVTLAVPLRDNAGRLIGVTDTDFGAGSLSVFMQEIQSDLPGLIFLVEQRADGSRRVVAHSDFAKLGPLQENDLDRDPLTREVVRRLPADFRAFSHSGETRGAITFSFHGEDYLAGYTALEGPNVPGWLAVAVLPRSAAVDTLNQIQRYSLLALLAVAAVGTVVAGYVARRVTQPLVRLADDVEKMGDDTRAKPLREEGPDEVVLLARRFNHITERLRSRQAELVAVEGQLRARTDRLQRVNETLFKAAQISTLNETEPAECAQRLTRLCCEALQVTRAAVWRLVADPERLRMITMFDAPTGKFITGMELKTADYPEYWRDFLHERRVATMDCAADPRTAKFYAEQMSHLGRVALLDVAIRAHEETLGIFSFHQVNPQRDWTAEDEILVLAVADLLALGFERTGRQQAEESVRERAQRLAAQNAALAEITEVMKPGAELLPAVRRINEISARALKVDRAALWLWRDEERGPALSQIDAFIVETGEHRAGIELPEVNDALLWARLAASRCFAVNRLADHPEFSEPQRNFLQRQGLNAVVLAAVRSQGRVVGLVGFGVLGSEGRTWTTEDELFASAVADLTALQIESDARRRAEAITEARSLSLARQNTALAEANLHVVGQPDLLGGVRAISEICARAVPVDAITFWLRDGKTDEIRQINIYEPASSRHRPGRVLPAGAYPRMIERLLQVRTLIFAQGEHDPDYADFYRDQLAPLGRVSTLHATLRLKGEGFGLVAFLRINRDEPWTPEEEAFAGAVADILTLQMETAARRTAEETLRAQAERLARQDAALSRATRSQTLREGQLEPAFRELSEICAEGMGVSRASVWLIRPPSQHLQLIDLYDRARGEHSQGTSINLTTVPSYHQALAHDRVIAADDATTDPRTAELAAGHLVPHGINSMLDAGVFSRGELVGAVCFEQVGAHRHWEQEEELFASAVADLAALALEAAARRTAEEEIERSRERLQRFIEGVPLAVIDWDRHIRIVGWNPAAERIFGYPFSAGLGRDGLFLVPPDDRMRHAEIWRELALGRASYIARATNLTSDGRLIYCDWHNTVLRDEQGRMIGASSLVEDVTERVRSEEEIRQLNTGLEQRVADRTADLEAANDKLKELDRLKSEFLATMSHELRTPLNSIIGFTGILKQGMVGPVSDEQRKQLEMVYSSARHLLGLINDLLDLSRIEAGRLQLEMKDFSPAEALREAADSLTPMVQLKRLTFTVEPALAGLVIRGDRKRFYQIVVNLANNAVKFTERGGVRISLKSEAGRLWVRVVDTGPGIRGEHLGGLFEAFRQLDGSVRRVYEGTGLGLYLCRKLVRLLGGEIGVESEHGQGSTFWFWVPCDGIPLDENSRTPLVLAAKP